MSGSKHSLSCPLEYGTGLMDKKKIIETTPVVFHVFKQPLFVFQRWILLLHSFDLVVVLGILWSFVRKKPSHEVKSS